MKCTFFGHRTVPQEVEPRLRKAIVNLIEHHSADTFYVGNQGGFDHMVQKVLKEIKEMYPHIAYYKVLAYMPGVRDVLDTTDYSDTIYPKGLENTPRKFAISKRNRWLIAHCDTVIAYVKYSTGSAAQFEELAEKKQKWIINITIEREAPYGHHFQW